MVLPGRYEVAAADLGDLLLLIGQQLGCAAARGAPPREAYQIPADEISEPDPAGWITYRATRLRFPPVCCECGAATTDVLRFEVGSRSLALQAFVPIAGDEVTIPVPVCESCQTALRTRRRAAVFGVCSPEASRPAGFAARCGSWRIRNCGARNHGRRRACRLRHREYTGLSAAGPGCGYSALRGTVWLRFRNPEYAATVVELIRQRRTMR